jgi:hypothetical protein
MTALFPEPVGSVTTASFPGGMRALAMDWDWDWDWDW